MKSSLLKWTLGFGLVFGLVLTSCNEDATSDTLDEQELTEYTEELISRTTEATASGKRGCFELVMPITIEFPDGTSVEVASMDEFKQAVRRWRQANPDVRGRAQIAFPIEVVTADGNVVTVDDAAEMQQLRRECWRQRIDDKRGERCFRLNYPLTIVYPNGTEVSYDTPRAMQQGLRRWRRSQDGQPTRVRPQVAFPVDVTLEDGTVLTIDSQEQMKRLKESCMD